MSIFTVMVILFTSCNLSDFESSRLTKPSGLNPIVYRPFSVGTYAVKDYFTVPGSGNTPFILDSLNCTPISYSLSGMSFNTTGIDSMIVIIKTINETPMKYRYRLSYTGKTLDSGSKTKFLTAATINAQGDVIELARDSLEFKLDSFDVQNLRAATRMDLTITLFKPDKGAVLSNVLKTSRISFYIGFRAPINLFKL